MRRKRASLGTKDEGVEGEGYAHFDSWFSASSRLWLLYSTARESIFTQECEVTSRQKDWVRPYGAISSLASVRALPADSTTQDGIWQRVPRSGMDSIASTQGVPVQSAPPPLEYATNDSNLGF